MKLYDLYIELCTISRSDKTNKAELIYGLYDAEFDKAIMAEGFTEKQAQIISGSAYERGHSAGCTEIVSVAMEIVDFSSQLLAAK